MNAKRLRKSIVYLEEEMAVGRFRGKNWNLVVKKHSELMTKLLFMGQKPQSTTAG